MDQKSMRSLLGASTLPFTKGPASASGSNVISGRSSVPNNDQKTDKRISVGWHWTYGWLRRPECDEPFGYAYEEPDGDMVFISDVTAKKRVMLQCCEDQHGERYICLYKD